MPVLSPSTGLPSQTPDETPPEPSVRYVALGDSFTAAPFVPSTDSTDPCLRSDANYPSLVAAARPDIGLIDVSCSGADSGSMTGPQELGSKTQPPQLDALTPDTDLVTLGIGGNDEGLFFGLVTRCALGDTPCEAVLDPDGQDPLVATIGRIEASVAGVVRRIKRRAPRARILVVTYPQLLPEGRCPAGSPLSGVDYTYGAELNRALSDAVASGARDAGAGVIDVFGASAGHEICSTDPWVNGPTTDPARALAFHPFAVEQEAVAQLILRRVGAS